MPCSNDVIASITPYIESETTPFHLTNWTPLPGFQLVKVKLSERYYFVDTKNNIAVFTLTLLPYEGIVVGDKPGVLVHINQVAHPTYCEAIRRFPYTCFFTHLLSQYTIVLTGEQQSVESYRFWFRRISWALSEGYGIYSANDKTKRPLFSRIPDWAIFFNEWLKFCHSKINTPRGNNIMLITTEKS